MAVVLGSTGTGSAGQDFENAGVAIAAKFTALATTTVDTISVRVHTLNLATTVLASVYNDSSGSPGTKNGATVTLTLPASPGSPVFVTSTTGAGAAITNGTVYWLGFLPPSGGGAHFDFKLFDSTTAAGTKDTVATGQTTMPSPFGTISGSFTELINAYAEDAGSAIIGHTFIPQRMPLGA